MKLYTKTTDGPCDSNGGCFRVGLLSGFQGRADAPCQPCSGDLALMQNSLGVTRAASYSPARMHQTNVENIYDVSGAGKPLSSFIVVICGESQR